MAAQTTEFTFRDFLNLWVRKPTIAAISGPGEPSDPATATLTIVWTNDGTPEGSTFTFDEATT